MSHVDFLDDDKKQTCQYQFLYYVIFFKGSANHLLCKTPVKYAHQKISK